MTQFRDEADALDAIRTTIAGGDADGAFVLAERAVAELPRSSRLRALAAALHAEEGFGDEARAHAAAAESLAPHDPGRASAALAFAKLGTPIEPQAFAAAHRAFSTRFTPSLAAPLDSARRAGPLRILFGGLDAHVALTRFVPGVLRHAPADVEVAVSSANRPLLEHYRARCPRVRIVALPPDVGGAYVAVRAYAPDVLVDLAGHGPNNILPLLASRCAARQVTWLDYLATTGLSTVHGRVTDGVADPAGNERWHVEPLLKLPVPAWSYEPWPEAPPVSVPAGTTAIRLGCACVPAKLNDRSLELFASVLAALPRATLALVGFRSRRGVERVLAAFGAAAARVTCLPRLTPAQYLAEVASWDLALDTVGFSGGTSTLDALWQGVPVVTAPLVLSHTRSSASLLAGLGETDSIAADAHGYVAAALRAIESDRARPGQRAERRRRVQSSSLGDAAQFAAHFYAAVLDRLPATREALPA